MLANRDQRVSVVVFEVYRFGALIVPELSLGFTARIDRVDNHTGAVFNFVGNWGFAEVGTDVFSAYGPLKRILIITTKLKPV